MPADTNPFVNPPFNVFQILLKDVESIVNIIPIEIKDLIVFSTFISDIVFNALDKIATDDDIAINETTFIPLENDISALLMESNTLENCFA